MAGVAEYRDAPAAPLLSAPWPFAPEGDQQFHSKSSQVKAEVKINPQRGTLV